MRNNCWLALLSVLLITCSEKKQNFVFILVDDLGWKDLSYMGSTFYETPNIDALSRESFQFTNAYASASICSPSRASILTGKHPARLNITDWIPGWDPKNEKLLGPKDLDVLPNEHITLAEVFKSAGYKTFFAGKWHLGGEGNHPENQGFDINIGGHHVGSPPGGYYTPYKNPKLTDGPTGEYLTDRLTNESIHFLNTVDQDPFFLFLSFYTVHTPIQPNKEYIDKFENKLIGLEKTVQEYREEGRGITTLIQSNADYASMVFALDQNIGRLISALKEKGLYENTTLVFTSDNGGLSTLIKKRANMGPTSVEPLRAGKGWLYEGGIRVPLLIKPANYNGEPKVVTVPVIGHDFYPTLLSMAGISTKGTTAIDGVDLTPLLHRSRELDRKAIFWHYPHYHGSGSTPSAAIRYGEWKLIEFHESGRTELYNLSEDISEENDLSGQFPNKVEQLKTKLHEMQQNLQAKNAVINPDYLPIDH